MSATTGSGKSRFKTIKKSGFWAVTKKQEAE